MYQSVDLSNHAPTLFDTRRDLFAMDVQPWLDQFGEMGSSLKYSGAKSFL